ncbi:unnamed protein product [Ceutorhynchus assimilis]|uniref:Uncharacterized protein n=1 Tax=Ceutorhynchus assimilis TaxID=467358 RepID=A0A9N9N2A7_9CUCU|nr:unnamed protein product [Ceutorhynchus assimilis]
MDWMMCHAGKLDAAPFAGEATPSTTSVKPSSAQTETAGPSNTLEGSATTGTYEVTARTGALALKKSRRANRRTSQTSSYWLDLLLVMIAETRKFLKQLKKLSSTLRNQLRLANAHKQPLAKAKVASPKLKSYTEEASLQFLKVAIEPYARVLEAWEDTLSSRKRLYATVSLNDVFNELPCLKQGFGIELIETDFNRKYPDSVDIIYSTWPKVAEAIIKEAKERKIYLPECSDENIQALLVFPYLFQPITIKKKTEKDATGDRVEVKFKKASFFMYQTNKINWFLRHAKIALLQQVFINSHYSKRAKNEENAGGAAIAPGTGSTAISVTDKVKFAMECINFKWTQKRGLCDLRNKFEIPANLPSLTPPKLNPEVAAALAKSSITTESSHREVQN